MSSGRNDEPVRLPRWVRDYSASIGILCFVIAIFLYQSQLALVSMMVVGFVFIGLSMLAALSGPPGGGGTADIK